MSRRIALLSVYHKDGIVDFAKALVALNFDILASGGTARALADAEVPVRDVAEMVGPAILGHRVVTLSREVHAGLLATLSDADIAELERLGIPRIDLVCVDLYPLEEEVAKSSATLASVIDKTDIGGPTMLRSAAKGQRIVVSDPSDRELVLAWIADGQPDKEEFLRSLAAKAEYVAAAYALVSASYLGQGSYRGVIGRKVMHLRYGENPHQKHAALYRAAGAPGNDPLGLPMFRLVGGEKPSYINMTDIDRMLETAARLAASLAANGHSDLKFAIAVKHGNVCGLGIARHQFEAVRKMIESDPESLFGGSVLVAHALSESEARLLRTHGLETGERPIDVVVAPDITEEARAVLTRANGKCRMFVNKNFLSLGKDSVDLSARMRQVRGGFLIQDPSQFILQLPQEWLGKTTKDEQIDLIVAWAVGSTATSNSVVLVTRGMLLGRGLAMPSRVLACDAALMHACANAHSDKLPYAVAYSDSYFPFPDGPEILANAGVKTIFSTSGSVRDAEVAEACTTRGALLLQLPDAEARGFSQH